MRHYRPATALAAIGAAFALTTAFSTNAADSTTTPPAPPQGKPPAPPPEAVAACKGKTAGAQVSFTGRNGETITGTCELLDGVLAARPTGMPPGGGRPPAPPSGTSANSK